MKGLLFQKGEKKVPKWIVLQLLEECNLRCKMCYEWGESGAYKGKKELSMLELEKVKAIIEQCESAHPYYELFGGEPFLYPYIFEVIDYIHKHGSKVDIATNGTLLEKYVKKIVDCKATRIWVSVDGMKEINDRQRGAGSYEKAVLGIKKFLECRKEDSPKIGITTIITPENANSLSEFFFSFVKECFIDHVSFEFQNYATEEKYSAYRQFLKDNFDVEDTTSAKGLIRDKKEFAAIDCEWLEKEMLEIKAFCEEKKIHFFHNPSTIKAGNYRSYFTADWDNMEDRKTRCPFVWIHAEVAASGEVIICHTLQDLSFGTIYNTDFLQIWNSEKSQKFRELLRKGMMPMCIACSRYYTQTAGHNE